MSCGVVLAVSLLLSDPTVAVAPGVPATAAAPASVASEPLFADIIGRSGRLHDVVKGWLSSGASERDGFASESTYLAFRGHATELAELDMQGHRLLAERGTDGDLKCILRGIAEDLPKRLGAVETATSATERRSALDELAYLLNDNVEVITAPPRPPV